MSRRTTTIDIAALSLAVVLLGVANWDDDEKGERIRVTEEPKGSPVAPPGYSLDAPAQPAPRWDPNAARNSTDLHAAFVQARDSSNPVAWYVAAEICGACFARHIERTFINKYIGEYNSIRAGDPNRAVELAALKRRQVALAELDRRCKGFDERGYDRDKTLAAYSELIDKAERSDTPLGRVMRALGEDWAPDKMKEGLASGDPVITRFALQSFARQLHDKQTAAFSYFGALLAAHERIVGKDFDRNDMQELGNCIADIGHCDTPAPYPPADWSAKDRAAWESLVGQYEAALRANDVKAILAAKPN